MAWPIPPATHIDSSPEPAVDGVEVVEQGGHDPRAGHPERVAERDRAAVGVELVRVDAELVAAGHDLRRERLVHLDHVHVVDRHARRLEHRPDRRDRAEAHDLRANRRHRGRDDARPGLEAHSRALSSDITSTAAAPSLSGHALPAVTVPPGLKTGLSCASFSAVVPGRGPSSRVTVCAAMTSPPASWVSGMSTPTISRSKWPLVARRRRTLLRERRPLVLGFAADLAARGHVLGRDPHRDVHVVRRAV